MVSTNLQTLAASYKSCKFTLEGFCILEAKFGKIVFPNDESIVGFQAKKISGNGQIDINGIVYSVHSKVHQTLDISSQGKFLHITRPATATGEVMLLDFVYYEKNSMKRKWKSIINQCGEYRSIRLIDDHLRASEGAFLENGTLIASIETNPPNCTFLENGKLKFSSSCEILNINLKETITNNNSASLEFPHLAPISPQLFSNQPTPTNPLESRLKSKTIMLTTPPEIISDTTSEFNNVLYNSDLVREFSHPKQNSSKLNNIKYLKSNGQDFLVLKRGGTFTIPISNIQPNSEYCIELMAQRLNGNGKIQVGSTSNGIFSGQIALISNFCQQHILNIKTPTNGFNKLQIKMVDDGVGEVLISKIIISSKNQQERPTFSNSSDIKRFVIVIPSYKNALWCERNIHSVMTQNYPAYRVIYTDDASPDGTFDKVSHLVTRYNKPSLIKLIHNSERVGALENLHRMIHSCDDDEIILTLDGDDWLADDSVLEKLNRYYSTEDIWMSYGQYQNHPRGEIGISRQIPEDIIKNNSFRQHAWCSSHLRTFYAWLFKQIKLEDFKYEGKFMSMAWDMTMMFPMLEMAGKRSKFISDILYVYNLENPINDHKVNLTLQQRLDRHVRGMPKYSTLQAPLTRSQVNIGLLVIATGKYERYLPGLLNSADTYFLNKPGYQVNYFIFSDKNPQIKSSRNIVRTHIEHKPFPFASMDRFKHFTQHASLFDQQDYLFYVDVDCLFVDQIGEEILGNLTGVRHCGFVNGGGTYEDNPNSVFYVEDLSRYQHYFGGGFSGGKREEYLGLARWCYEQIEVDLSNGRIPRYHDESALNRYFLDHPPDVVLSPSYHYPQGDIVRYKQMWQPHSFEPKILLLEKNHTQMRS